MPRFVILEHDWPMRHWDLLLESGTVLRAWRLLAEPLPGTTVPAETNYDHRLLYLDYEGPLSGERGRVDRWADGIFEWIEDRPDLVTVQVASDRLSGIVKLKGAGGRTWFCRIDNGSRVN